MVWRLKLLLIWLMVMQFSACSWLQQKRAHWLGTSDSNNGVSANTTQIASPAQVNNNQPQSLFQGLFSRQNSNVVNQQNYSGTPGNSANPVNSGYIQNGNVANAANPFNNSTVNNRTTNSNQTNNAINGNLNPNNGSQVYLFQRPPIEVIVPPMDPAEPMPGSSETNSANSNLNKNKTISNESIGSKNQRSSIASIGLSPRYSKSSNSQTTLANQEKVDGSTSNQLDKKNAGSGTINQSKEMKKQQTNSSLPLQSPPWPNLSSQESTNQKDESKTKPAPKLKIKSDQMSTDVIWPKFPDKNDASSSSSAPEQPGQSLNITPKKSANRTNGLNESVSFPPFDPVLSNPETVKKPVVDKTRLTGSSVGNYAPSNIASSNVNNPNMNKVPPLLPIIEQSSGIPEKVISALPSDKQLSPKKVISMDTPSETIFPVNSVPTSPEVTIPLTITSNSVKNEPIPNPTHVDSQKELDHIAANFPLLKKGNENSEQTKSGNSTILNLNKRNENIREINKSDSLNLGKSAQGTQEIVSDPPLIRAMREYLAKHPEKAVQSLQNLDEKNQEVLLQILPMIARLSEHEVAQLQPDEVAVYIDQLQNMVNKFRERASLKIGTICYCRKVTKFGQYEPLPKNHRFIPGEPVDLYVELFNFTWHREPAVNALTANYRMSLGSRIELRDSHEQLVWQRELTTTDNRRKALSDYYLDYRFFVPELKPGKYKLSIQIRDQLDQLITRSSQRQLDFEIDKP